MAPPTPANYTVDPSLLGYEVLIHEYLAKLNETSVPKLQGVAAGAVIFSAHHPAGQPDRVLLVQRASHDSMPDRWEIPGGAVDEGETVLGGVVREVREESGLAVRRLAASLGPGAAFQTSRGSLFVRLTFVVEVADSSAVTLDPDEHQDYVWATEDECRANLVDRSAEGKGQTELVFTADAQKADIMRAFEIRRKDRGA